MEQIQTIGLREFRANLNKYTKRTKEPIAITSHGEAVGYYIPIRGTRQEQELASLLDAVRKLTSLLKSQGVDADDIMADFQAARSQQLQT